MTGSMDPVALLASIYGVTTTAPLERLGGGDCNAVYNVAADDPWILRVSHERKRQAQLEFELAVMSSLRERLPYIPRLRLTTDGRSYGLWHGHFCCLFELLSGSPLRSSDDVATLAGTTLGHIHNELEAISGTLRHVDDLSLVGFDWRNNYFYDGDPLDVAGWPEGLPENDLPHLAQVESRTAYLRSLRSDLSRWLEDCRRQGMLTEGITHGDYGKRNVLSDGARVTAVLDWDECITSWTEYEAANAAWEFSRGSGQYRTDHLRQSLFLDAYCTVRHRPPFDPRLVARLIAVRRMIEVQRELYQLRQGGQYDLAYCARNVRYLCDAGVD